jgi:hypothetical protein
MHLGIQFVDGLPDAGECRRICFVGRIFCHGRDHRGSALGGKDKGRAKAAGGGRFIGKPKGKIKENIADCNALAPEDGSQPQA